MASFQRAEERLPPNEETDNDDGGIFNLNGLERNPGNLVVTSSLHPFWHTKKGGAVIGLVVLTVIGAIVGGAIGGAKAKRRNITSSLARTSPSQVSNGCSPSVTDTAFGTTTHLSDIGLNTTPGI